MYTIYLYVPYKTNRLSGHIRRVYLFKIYFTIRTIYPINSTYTMNILGYSYNT